MHSEQSLTRLAAHPVTHENVRGRNRDRGRDRSRLLNPYGSQIDRDRDDDCDPDPDPDIPGFGSIYGTASHAPWCARRLMKMAARSGRRLPDGAGILPMGLPAAPPGGGGLFDGARPVPTAGLRSEVGCLRSLFSEPAVQSGCILSPRSIKFATLIAGAEVAVNESGSSRERWALILGASSGFGAAAGLALARSGCHILGVHLDRRATLPNVERLVAQIRSTGRKASFFNVNAADAARRAEVIRACGQETAATPGSSGIEILLHSLAFGSLKPFIAAPAEGMLRFADMNMTLDVMAHSLVYWVQDLFTADLLRRGARIFAMTSAGGHRVWEAYGAVSAAKAALESHVRQLAFELAPYGISVNAVRAGVADTPAAHKIPGHERIFAQARAANPGRRLTTPEDVAEALVALASCRTSWMTGNVIGVDGGEDLC